MHVIAQVFFLLLAGSSVWLFARNIRRIRQNILLGQEEAFDGQKKDRWRNVLLLAFGQKKMFRNPLVAVMHFLIYAGFIIINLEVLEIVLDGMLGTHRLFLEAMGNTYTWLINAFEFLAVLVILACIIFLLRRNLMRIRRFRDGDLDGWPRSDANYILITEIILMSLFLTMNGADQALQAMGEKGYHPTGHFIVSGWIAPALAARPSTSLMFLERSCWWLHIAGIFAFLNYLPYSKHLHILLAFPNAYYARLSPKGMMRNMPSVQQEVLYAMQPELAPSEPAGNIRFGARDIGDLSWRNLLDAYTCTECGRCSASCPANLTGKKLSPRRIMMATRDRMEEAGRNARLHQGKFQDDGKSLLGDYISEEELRACTTCNACVEECPVSISPLEIILELRRSLIMEDSKAPAEWNALFSNVENNFAPWKFSPDDRDAWARD